MTRSIKKAVLNPSLNPWLGAVIYCLIVLLRVTRLAQGLNIRNVIAAPVGDWHNMVNCKLFLFSTAGTAVVVLVTKCLPFCGGMRTARCSFCMIPAFGALSILFGVIPFPAPLALAHHLWIFGFPGSVIFLVLIRILLPPVPASLAVSLWVFPYPLPAALAGALHTTTDLIPITLPAFYTRLPISLCHNQKISLPTSPIKRLELQSLSGRLLRPHVLGLLIAIARTLLLISQIIPQRSRACPTQ